MSDYNISFGTSFHQSQGEGDKQNIKVVQKLQSQDRAAGDSTIKIQSKQLIGFSDLKNDGLNMSQSGPFKDM